MLTDKNSVLCEQGLEKPAVLLKKTWKAGFINKAAFLQVF